MDEGSRRRVKTLGGDFWKFWTGQTISNLGSSFTFFALPLLVYELTGSAINLAITTASEFVPYLLFGLVIGAYVDRVDRKRLMIAVDILRALVLATIPLLAALDLLNVWIVYGVAFANSTLNIFFDSAQWPAIANIVGGDDLVAANGRIQASYSGAQIVGPILAGALAAIMPIVDVLLFDALSFILSAISLALVRSSFNADAPEEKEPTTILTDVKEGLSYVLKHPVLRTISIMMALYNFVGTSLFTQLVLFADRQLGASDSQIGILYAAGSAGIALLSLSAGRLRKRWSFSKVALGALFLDGLLSFVFARTTFFPVAVVVWGLASGFGILFNVQTISLRQLIVPDRMLGRIMSVAGVLAWSAIPLGAYLGGLAIERTGDVALVFSAIGVILMLIPIVFAFSPLGRAERYIPADKLKETAVEADEATAPAVS